MLTRCGCWPQSTKIYWPRGRRLRAGKENARPNVTQRGIYDTEATTKHLARNGKAWIQRGPDERSGARGDGGPRLADSREVMNIRQAAQYLGVSPDTLYKYVGEQKIPAFKLGNRWRFKKSKLDQWMEDKSEAMLMGGRGR